MAQGAVIGLDGAAWHLVDPLIERGIMPNLAALKAQGAAGILASTVPTYTPPAWTSAATGVNPGRHGIYGFVEGHAQHEGLNLIHSGKIKVPTIWNIANAQGARIGVYNVPLTYPPRELDGWMVSGMMTPFSPERLRDFARPRSIEEEILSLVPDYIVDISPNWENDWRDDSLCLRIQTSLSQRKLVLETLLDGHDPDVLFAVLEAPDRLQHVYYRYLDPADPMYSTKQAARLRREIDKCFKLMDDILGIVCSRAPSVICCSDHGFTAWEASVHTNALLQEWGYLKLRRGARVMQTSAARRGARIARRILPGGVARRAKTKTFAAVDWSRTRAFASPIPLQGIYLNVAGREPFGVIPPEEVDVLKRDLLRRFEALLDRDGNPVTDRVWLAEDVFHGPAVEWAPDVMPVLREHRFELDDEIFHRDPFTDQSHLPRGVHHPDGIVALQGPGVMANHTVAGSVLDIMPTLLYMSGLQVPTELDGRVLEDAFEPAHLNSHPISLTDALPSTTAHERSPYSVEEEAQIEESLRSLGYL